MNIDTLIFILFIFIGKLLIIKLIHYILYGTTIIILRNPIKNHPYFYLNKLKKCLKDALNAPAVKHSSTHPKHTSSTFTELP